ncbi:MAG: MFS transporter [Notoacmeibacter sp.]|nr:MFS transporter [Notoacmeibacter sp.]
MTAPGKHSISLRLVPAGVWAVGLVSMFMDISSEMIHALLPVYLVSVMGASTTTVGLIEGIAEATASIVKIFSGALSDWLGKRKLLAIAGYGLAAITKPVFPLAPTVGWLVAARFVDRIGKGIRGAPRDALVADITPPHLRGSAFGLRQALDTAGAFAGPLIAIALMVVFAGDFRAVFWVAVIPAFMAVVILAFAVHDPKAEPRDGKARFPLRRAELAKLPGAYWLIVLLAAIFSLARFSEAFLILRASDAGLGVALVPLVLVVMNLTYALAAYPAGALSDRTNRLSLLGMGIVLLIAADTVLALSSSLAGAALGVVLWGLHLGFTQGLLSALVADTAGPRLRGTAFGIFNLVSGLALLAASVAAGIIWDLAGAPATFAAGAAIAALAVAVLLVIRVWFPMLGSAKDRN